MAEAVGRLRGPTFSGLVITHYMRILGFLAPDVVHVLHGGKVVRSGGPELAEELERTGYGSMGAELHDPEVMALPTQGASG